VTIDHLDAPLGLAPSVLARVRIASHRLDRRASSIVRKMLAVKIAMQADPIKST